MYGPCEESTEHKVQIERKRADIWAASKVNKYMDLVVRTVVKIHDGVR